MHPRLLVSQSIHVDKWKVPCGQFIAVNPDKTLTIIGGCATVSLLAVRNTAIRVAEPASLGRAVEKYHETTSVPYRRIHNAARAGRSASMCYEGPELLMWVHDMQSLATMLLASNAGKHAWNGYTRDNHDAMRRVTSIRAVRGNVGTINFHTIKFAVAEELSWNRVAKFKPDIERFIQQPADVDAGPVRDALNSVGKAIREATKVFKPAHRKAFFDALASAADKGGFTMDDDEFVSAALDHFCHH